MFEEVSVRETKRKLECGREMWEVEKKEMWERESEL